MSSKLSKNQLEKYSRQIILKNIGILGQKKILNSKVLIIGMGGLGCPVAEFLTRSGVGSLGIVDHDLISLSNIHRQTLYDEKDLGKLKVKAAKELISPTGIMVIFILIKPGAILDNKLIRNIEATKEYLNQNGVRWSYFSEDSTKYAVGYSKETLELVSQMNVDLISIMARVS